MASGSGKWLPHRECIKRVCVGCDNKKGQKPKRAISDTDVDLIRKYVFKPFSTDNLRLPQGLCNACRMALFHKEKGTRRVDCLQRPAADFICEPPPVTDDSYCVCSICHIGRLEGSEWMIYTQKSNRPKSRRGANQSANSIPDLGGGGGPADEDAGPNEVQPKSTHLLNYPPHKKLIYEKQILCIIY